MITFIKHLTLLIIMLGVIPTSKLWAASISFSPQNSIVSVGDSFAVDIIASDFTELAGGVLDFSFDSSQLSLNFIPMIDAYWDFFPDAGSQDLIDSNVWRGVGFDVFANAPLNGSGIIASLNFTALGIGASSLEILPGSAFFSSVTEINPELTTGSVQVVPLPPAIYLFLTGLIGLTQIMRSKHKN